MEQKSATIGKNHPWLHFLLIEFKFYKFFRYNCGYNIIIRYICIQYLAYTLY